MGLGMLVVLALGLGVAEAGEPAPIRDGVLVGAGSVGGILGGGLVGGAAGLGLGALSCRGGNGFECWGPLIGGSSGAVLGGLAGGVLTAGWTAKALGHDPRRVRKWGLITVGSSAALFGVGVATSVNALQVVGLYGGLGLPILTGVAAGTDPGTRSLSLSPVVGEGVQGVALSGRF